MKILILFVLLSLFSCKNTIEKAVSDTKYSAYEMIGVEKRDLFKREVNNVKDSQQDTQEEFSDALEKLQAVYKVSDKKLESAYKSLDSSYKDAEESVAKVKKNIYQLEKLSQDLFNEWQEEIKQMSSAELRRQSSETLASTQKKYNAYHVSLKKSESKMAPVLAKLKDQTLFVKHNLNAKVIAGLKTEADKIENEINSLIGEMKESINRGNEIIRDL